MKHNISVLNVQPLLLKKNLAKTRNNYFSKGLIRLVIITIVTLALLGVSFVKYSQSSRVAMHDKGFNTAVFFYLHSSSGYAKESCMGNVINLISLTAYTAKLKADGGMWEFKPGKWIIKHLEVEGLAQHYNIETNIDLVHCNLDKDIAVVKATALNKTKKFDSFGEVSPKNNEFDYPVAVAEKRAVDRAILKALGIHGNVYSDQEMPNEKQNNNENSGIKLDHVDVILERVKTVTHQANLEQLKSQNKKFLTELKTQDLTRYEEVKNAFLNRKQQLTKG